MKVRMLTSVEDSNIHMGDDLKVAAPEGSISQRTVTKGEGDLLRVVSVQRLDFLTKDKVYDLTETQGANLIAIKAAEAVV